MDNLRASLLTSKLESDLYSGRALAVSHGSFFPDSRIGSCAWILSSADGTEWISGGGVVPGQPNIQSAYRSELAGQLGIAAVLNGVHL